MDPLRKALDELRKALDDDQPVGLTDGELAELCELAADELSRRLPRYALDQGDLDEDSEPEIDSREDLLVAVKFYRAKSLSPS